MTHRRREYATGGLVPRPDHGWPWPQPGAGCTIDLRLVGQVVPEQWVYRLPDGRVTLDPSAGGERVGALAQPAPGWDARTVAAVLGPMTLATRGFREAVDPMTRAFSGVSKVLTRARLRRRARVHTHPPRARLPETAPVFQGEALVTETGEPTLSRHLESSLTRTLTVVPLAQWPRADDDPLRGTALETVTLLALPQVPRAAEDGT